MNDLERLIEKELHTPFKVKIRNLITDVHMWWFLRWYHKTDQGRERTSYRERSGVWYVRDKNGNMGVNCIPTDEDFEQLNRATNRVKGEDET